LEGSIQQSGNKIRITAQLIDALTGRHLWAQRYERDYKDIFALQDEITLKILNEIGVKLTEGERIRSHVTETTNLDAYEKALEGVTYLRAFNIENNATARRLAQEAIALAPEYYLGYNLLAAVNIMDVWLGSSESIPKSLAQATELLQKAIDLDENNDQAYSLLCHIYGMQRQFDKAVAVGEKAIEVNPNSDAAYVWLAMPLRWMGEAEKAIELHKKAMRLCPFPPAHYYASLGDSYLIAGRVEEALAEYKKALHLAPRHIDVLSSLSICYGLSGLEEKSRAAAAEVIELDPNYNTKYYMKIWSVFKNQEMVKIWADTLRKAGIPDG
jgi:adenylate cyclase